MPRDDAQVMCPATARARRGPVRCQRARTGPLPKRAAADGPERRKGKGTLALAGPGEGPRGRAMRALRAPGHRGGPYRRLPMRAAASRSRRHRASASEEAGQ
jgi:hypothetical protein